MKKLNYDAYTPDEFRNLLREAITAQASEGNVTLEAIASRFQASPTQFYRLVKYQIGETPAQVILRIRIEEVCKLFASNPRILIKEAAMRYGFSDKAHFAHVFRRLMGCSPTEYARRCHPERPLKLSKASQI